VLATSSMQRLSALRRKATKTFGRLCAPIWPDTLRSALDRVTVGGADIMCVHSSLSSCGQFTAGPMGVLNVLSEFCDTLCLPTHTYCYPESPNAPGPLFNAATTPSVVGYLTEVFRKRSGVLRSIHATHSLAASGRLAEELCANHYRYDTPCGAGTPYSRLVEKRATVLMFGVTFAYYTPFHTAEWESGSDYAYVPGELNWLRIVDEAGEQRDCWSRRQGRTPPRFEQVGGFLERAGLVRQVPLGRSRLLFVPDCSKVHDLLVEQLRKTSDFLRASCTVEL
jgi:aminoglycoside 3-N-acetyltransferase